MKKRFQLIADNDTSITLEIDTDKMTAELAKEVNNFWSGARYVLEASDGCVFQAVARRAASALLVMLIEGSSWEGAIYELSEREGWPGGDMGIAIIDHETPDLEPDMLVCLDQTPRQTASAQASD